MISSFVSKRRATLNISVAFMICAAFGLGRSATASGIFDEIPGLSPGAQSSLVAHYDGSTGVDTTGTTVNRRESLPSTSGR